MKKRSLLALLLVLVLSLTGCGMSRSVTKEEKEDIDYGTVQDGTYQNTHFGFGYRFEEGWNTKTQKQVWQGNGWDPDKDIRKQMMDALKKPGYFNEMHTENQEQTITVDVGIDNASVLADPDISQADYAEYTAEQNLDHFNQLKVGGVEAELIERTVAGIKMDGVRIWFEDDGTTNYFTFLYMKKGIYATEIKVTCNGEDVTEAILENFFAVENQPS